MFEFFTVLLVGAGAFFYFYGKRTPVAGSTSSQNISKIKELDDQDDEVYSMFFDVVGESFKNDDGTSRQEIIEKYARESEPVHLKFYNYKGSMACAVFLDDEFKKQIGHIAKDEVEDVYELATGGLTIDPRIYSVGTGPKGLYGVQIEILVEDK
jgi:hypothetical protein